MAKYDDTDPDLPIFIAIKGHIFDVTQGRSFYGANGGYHFFAGRDGTRSFSTGCFDVKKPLCTENAHIYDDLNENQIGSINDWESFYRDSSKYHYVGELKRD